MNNIINEVIIIPNKNTKAYPEKLLHIMLHKRIKCFPSKTLGKFLCPNRFVRELQLIENSLQGQCNRPREKHSTLVNLQDFIDNKSDLTNVLPGTVVRFCRHLVNGLTQLICKIQRL